MVIDDINDIPKDSQYIVQKYVDNPQLIHDTKYDIRIHVVITSANPLHIYIYESGHIKFATLPYQKSDWQNLHRHITNVELNMKHEEFVYGDWKLKQLWEHFDSLGIDREIWSCQNTNLYIAGGSSSSLAIAPLVQVAQV